MKTAEDISSNSTLTSVHTFFRCKMSIFSQFCKNQGGKKRNTVSEKNLIDIVVESSISTTARKVEEAPTNNIPKIRRLAFVCFIARQSLKHLVKVKRRKEAIIKSLLH